MINLSATAHNVLQLFGIFAIMLALLYVCYSIARGISIHSQLGQARRREALDYKERQLRDYTIRDENKRLQLARKIGYTVPTPTNNKD